MHERGLEDTTIPLAHAPWMLPPMIRLSLFRLLFPLLMLSPAAVSHTQDAPDRTEISPAALLGTQGVPILAAVAAADSPEGLTVQRVLPQQYGAKGDGKADDAPALQKALNAAAATKSMVFLPGGTYRLNRSLSIPNGVKITGAGAGSAVLHVPATAAYTAIDLDARSDVLIQDLAIRSVGQGKVGDKAFGITIRGNSQDVTVRNVHVDGMAQGFHISGAGGDRPGMCRRITLSECISRGSTGTYGIQIEDADVVEILHCHGLENWLDGLKIRQNTRNVTVRGGSYNGNGKSYRGGGGHAGDGIDAYAGGDTFLLDGVICDANDGNGITIKTDALTRDKSSTFGIVRNIQVNNARCRNNRLGYGMAIYVMAARNDIVKTSDLPLPSNASVIGGQFEGNNLVGLWLNGLNITAIGPICRKNRQHGIEVGVRSINTTLVSPICVANGQSAKNKYHGIYLRGKQMRVIGGMSIGAEAEKARNSSDLAAAEKWQHGGIVVDGAYSEDVEIRDTVCRYNATVGIITNQQAGKCLTYQSGNGPPTSGLGTYGSIGSTYTQLDAKIPSEVLWVKTSGTPRQSRVGWSRVATTGEARASAGGSTLSGSTDSSGAAAMRRALSSTETLDFPRTPPYGQSEINIAIANAAPGDIVRLGTTDLLAETDVVTYSAWISAPNTLTVRLINLTDRTIDPRSRKFQVLVAGF